MKSHLCTECGEEHLVTPPHKEILNKLKLVMLQRAAAHVMSTMENNFMVREISQPEEYSIFHNFQKLRYHGLITPIKDDAGKAMKGQWLITRNGWAFLRGEKDLPKYVMISSNSVKSRSDERVFINTVARGVFEIQTQFEYFDDSGKPVGLRPAAPVELQQTSLV